MNTILKFFKTTLIGGLLIVLPLLLFYLLMDELLEAVVALATPIADLFPDEDFSKLSNPAFVGVVLIMAVSFLFGLALRFSLLATIGRWLEANTLGHLPFYRAIKQLSQGLIGSAESSAFRGGILDNNNGTQELCYIIEELDQNRTVVLIPFAPASFTGSTKIVENAMVRELPVSAGEVSKVIAHWGVGTAEALANTEEGNDVTQAGDQPRHD